MEGRDHQTRSLNGPTVIPGDGNPGPMGGGTYTGQSLEPTLQDWENIFGPASRDIKVDNQRHKRHTRWHLPDVLKGPNPYITDRIDGLISDATNSPFTTVILPYLYIENPDQQLTWAVWSFDEGLASRVPYESAARVLTQTKKSFAAYAVRHGLAITMEHNFMMSPKGRENFQNQLKQLVGSIQYSNDLDVHMALVTAPSYAKTWMEKYSSSDKTPQQICREYVDLFGIIQKNPNGLDILIEDAKATMKLWGSPNPSFLLSNQKLFMALTMTPEKTSYVTNGIDGVKRLRQGPDIGSYRGLSIINTRQFSMETGALPRDILRRRVRVAEYYRVPPQPANLDWYIELYDESRDTMFTITKSELDKYARLDRNNDCDYHILADVAIDLPTFLQNRYNPADNTDVMWPDTRVWRCKLVLPTNTNLTSVVPPENWNHMYQQLTQGLNNAFPTGDFNAVNYYELVEGVINNGSLRPNNTLHLHGPMPANATPMQAAAWVFTQTSLLDKTCRLMWRRVTIDPNFVSQHVIPFLFQAPQTASMSFAQTTDVLNPYTSVMVLGMFACLTPNLDHKMFVHDAFRNSGMHWATIRAAVVAFLRECFKPNAYSSRIQMGRMLEHLLQNAFARNPIPFEDKHALFSCWPSELDQAQHTICFRANLVEATASLDHPAIENAYRQYPQFRYNNVDRPTHEIICDNDEHVLATFFWVVNQRFWRDLSLVTRDMLFPAHLPYTLSQDQLNTDSYEYVLIRPCIEHNMLGVMMGRGGSEELGATLWGQTELSCYDDAFHGVWGMSYKYHERALVFNERNLIRLWDVAYDGYNGGKDDTVVDWTEEARTRSRPFHRTATDMSQAYRGPSIMVMKFKVNKNDPAYKTYWPSPIVFHDNYLNREPPKVSPDPDSVYVLQDANMRIFNNDVYREQYRAYHERMPDFSYFHQIRKPPGQASIDMETSQNALAFSGTYRVVATQTNNTILSVHGSGHHGPDVVGIASVRAGKGLRTDMRAPQTMRIV